MTPTVIGVMPCHTPACGWLPGMDRNAMSAVVQYGNRVLLWCLRCGGHWAVSPAELRERLQPDDASGVQP